MWSLWASGVSQGSHRGSLGQHNLVLLGSHSIRGSHCLCPLYHNMYLIHNMISLSLSLFLSVALPLYLFVVLFFLRSASSWKMKRTNTATRDLVGFSCGKRRRWFWRLGLGSHSEHGLHGFRWRQFFVYSVKKTQPHRKASGKLKDHFVFPRNCVLIPLIAYVYLLSWFVLVMVCSRLIMVCKVFVIKCL